MSFVYLLASTLVMSTILGISSNPTQIMYTEEDQTVLQSNETGQIIDVDDRHSNLKYVMAIQRSGIWSEIKQRSLTINSQQRLDDKAAAKSPSDLTDEELAQLKQACNDGLKCVAVDQLLVLKQVKEPLGDSKVTVRTAITKITQVLTQYTTEYHEDLYQYEAVQQSDDQSKMYESVTTIVEDNKELCQIDVTPATGESHRKNNDSNRKVVNNGTINYNTTKNYNVNNGTLNSATINDDPSDYITINVKPHLEGTVDSGRSKHKSPLVDSMVHTAATDDPTVVKSKKRSPDYYHVNAKHQPTKISSPAVTDDPTEVKSNKRSPDYYHVNAKHQPTKISSPAVTDGPITNRSVTKAPNYHDVERKHPRPNLVLDSQTPNQHYKPVTIIKNQPNQPKSADDHQKVLSPLVMLTNRPSPHNGVVSGKGFAAVNTHTDNSGGGRKTQQPRPNVTGRSDDGANAHELATNNSVVLDHSTHSSANNGKDTYHYYYLPEDTITNKAADNVNNNSVELNDSSSGDSRSGENDSDSDIVSAGSRNKFNVRKGMVEDGYLNNGNMKVKNFDKGNRNKGTIENGHTKNGDINVGTVNNGPTDYSTSNGYTNNGTTMDMNSYDAQQYVKSIDNIYSTILNEFAKE